VAGDGAGNQYIRGEEEETKIKPEGGKVPAAVLAGEKGAAERERGRGEVLVGGAVWVLLCFGQRVSRDGGGSVGFLSEGEEDLPS